MVIDALPEVGHRERLATLSLGRHRPAFDPSVATIRAKASSPMTRAALMGFSPCRGRDMRPRPLGARRPTRVRGRRRATRPTALRRVAPRTRHQPRLYRSFRESLPSGFPRPREALDLGLGKSPYGPPRCLTNA